MPPSFYIIFKREANEVKIITRSKEVIFNQLWDSCAIF